VLPGVAAKLGDPRTMPATDDPDLTAKAYISEIQSGQSPDSVEPLGEDGGFVAKMPDGAYIVFRPAGQASWKTSASTASVDINEPVINRLNGGTRLKLKFPRK
jgi:filamentous hemagglutinin